MLFSQRNIALFLLLSLAVLGLALNHPTSISTTATGTMVADGPEPPPPPPPTLLAFVDGPEPPPPPKRSPNLSLAYT